MIAGTGIDIVELSRFKKVVDKHGERFINRVFTQKERFEFADKISGIESQFLVKDRQILRKIAGKFAAKEAFLKALGTGLSLGITWKDVELLTSKNGAPHIVLHGKAAEISRKHGDLFNHVSISHSKSNAVAVVIMEVRT